MEAILDFYGIIGFFAIGQLLILLLYLLGLKGASSQLKLTFLGILGVIGFVLIHDTLVHTRLILYFPQFAFHGESFSLLIWPFIFFYIKISFGKKLRWIDLIHLLPFLAYQFSRLDLLLLPAEEKKLLLQAFYSNLIESEQNIRGFFVQEWLRDLLYYRLQPLVYIVWILWFIRKEWKRGQGITPRSRINIRWIRLIFFGYLAIWTAKYLRYLGGYFLPAMNAAHPIQIVFLALPVALLSLLLLQAGFRSVATFNRAFKRVENQTPSQYLRQFMN